MLLLEEIRGRPIQPYYTSGVELEQRYSKAFREYGIDVEVLEPGAPRNEFAAEAFASN